MELKDIDVKHSFTEDTKGFWDNFWEKNQGLGGSNRDPDSYSDVLKEYHRLLWSKELPCGRKMELKPTEKYLSWDEFHFGSDSIITEFRYTRYKSLLEQVKRQLPDIYAYWTDFLKKTYTIGGSIIFPKCRYNSINPRRGCARLVCDRWDLTLECIKRFYDGQESPLYRYLEANRAFFELFVDFKGYVDFFFLQDCVSEDYSKVKLWIPNEDFTEKPLPRSVEEYFEWMTKQVDFVNMRNQRINAYVQGNNSQK